MECVDQRQSNTNQTSSNQTKETRKDLRQPSTDEVRAMLNDLSSRPQSQREFLRKLLKRAAAEAATTDFVVRPAEPHHTATS